MEHILRQLPVFQGVPADALSRLVRRGTIRHFPAGAVLMNQGEESAGVHLILTGLVCVERAPSSGSGVVLAELGPGEVVGEIATLDQVARSATVTAREATETLELGPVVLAALMVEFPEVSASILGTLYRRLRRNEELEGEALRGTEATPSKVTPFERSHPLGGEIQTTSSRSLRAVYWSLGSPYGANEEGLRRFWKEADISTTLAHRLARRVLALEGGAEDSTGFTS